MNNNNNTVKKSILIAALLGLLGLAGWTFAEVRNLPAVYVNKIEMSKIEEKMVKRLDRIEAKLDTILYRKGDF